MFFSSSNLQKSVGLRTVVLNIPFSSMIPVTYSMTFPLSNPGL